MKTDLELIQEVKDGHKKSFEKLVLRHERFLMRSIVRMTRDLNVAEEILQDTFIKAFRRLHLFEGRSAFRSWLYQIALNTARNRFRRANKETRGLDGYDIAVDGALEKHVAGVHLRAILQKEVDRLPTRQRMALSLRIFDDLSFKEIAEIMECPYDTAKANYRHALMKLKERLEGNTTLKTWMSNSETLIEVHSHQWEVDANGNQ